MKILIFSDSHRNTEPMISAAEAERPDIMIHLGDLEADAMQLNKRFPDIPLYSVPGNCDLFPFGQRRLITEIGGKRFFITHGHSYNVKAGYESVVQNAMSAGADVLLFGHTHQEASFKAGDLLVINPGSVGYGSRTYGVLTINGDDMVYEKKYTG